MRLGYDVFTTGRVANVCGVAPRTVSTWCDRGMLRHYRIPGSTDRRILRKDLIEFLKQHGLDLNELEAAGVCRVLLVSVAPALCKQLRGHLPDNYALECAANGFDAGLRAERLKPDTTVIDLGHRSEGVAIGACMRKAGHGRLVALANEDEAQADELRAGGFADVFVKPFDAKLLAAWIEEQGNDVLRPQRWQKRLKAEG